jgi:phenylacetate-CoA ligase
MNTVGKKIFDMFMESQYWPPDQMLFFQRNQLAQLLHHAKANVPFYKTRLDCVIKNNGDIDWSRWHEIPIVKRHHLVEQRHSMLAERLPPGHGDTREFFSSGSSGQPIITTHNHLAGLASDIAVFRAHTWHKLDWSWNLVRWMGNDEQVAQWPDGEEAVSWAPDWLENQLRGKAYNINRSTPEEKVVEFALRKQARHLTGRPKSLQSIALAAERLKIEFKVDAVTVFSTGVTDDELDDFNRVLGAKVISFYSSGEGYKMGISCETGRHYHINSELTLLEILDDDGSPCPIGQPGRVIITNLFNTAQPLIRYEQGDIAVRGPDCACGKTLPVLQEISGRITHLFRFPDGRKVAPSLPDQEFNKGFGSKTWQLVQTGPLAAELRYVQTDPSITIDKSFAQKMIHKNIHPGLMVTFVQLAETPFTAAGKFIQYKSELAEGTNAP